MKRIFTYSCLASLLALLSSCTTPGGSSFQPLQPRADVEAIERQAPVEPIPNIGQHQAGRNAVDYANDRRRFGFGF